MAGLLLKELKARGLVQRTLIVVPGHLRDQWLREMKERFDEAFTVVDRSVVNATWGRNVWQEHPQIITSMDFAKQADIMAALAEARWDLTIVDEAHKLAAYRYGEKIARTERYPARRAPFPQQPVPALPDRHPPPGRSGELPPFPGPAGPRLVLHHRSPAGVRPERGQPPLPATFEGGPPGL